MSQGTDYRHQAKEAATRVEWCERKLSFERKRRKALDDLAAGEDWLEGKVSPMPTTKDSGKRS